MSLLGSAKQNSPAKQPVPTNSAKQTQVNQNSALQNGTVSLADILAPSSIEVDFKFIRVGDRYYRTFFVVGYPRYVSANSLQPLIDFDHSLDISMFIYPVYVDSVLSNLKQRVGNMRAAIPGDAEWSRVSHPNS